MSFVEDKSNVRRPIVKKRRTNGDLFRRAIFANSLRKSKSKGKKMTLTTREIAVMELIKSEQRFVDDLEKILKVTRKHRHLY